MDRVRRIEVLVRAAQAGSFAKAARLLHLDPSAVSHAVAQLEKELRVTLFYRTTRQLRLTEDGEELCRRGREILDRLSEMESAVSRKSARLTGTFRVGMGVPLSREIIMPRIHEFLRRHPGLRLECLVLTAVKDMHAGGVDLLLRVGEPGESGLIARKIAQLKFGVYAAPSYLDGAGEPASPDELVKHRCLVHKAPVRNQPLDEWEFVRGGERKVVNVPRTVVTDDREGLVAAAVAGAGLMRIGLFDPGLIKSGRLRRVLADWTCVNAPPLYAVYRKSQRPSPKISAFLDFVCDAIMAFEPEHLTVEPADGFAEFVRRIRPDDQT
jgi:LysR family transcriptional regulator for bpeEF and oprC